MPLILQSHIFELTFCITASSISLIKGFDQRLLFCGRKLDSKAFSFNELEIRGDCDSCKLTKGAVSLTPIDTQTLKSPYLLIGFPASTLKLKLSNCG